MPDATAGGEATTTTAARRRLTEPRGSRPAQGSPLEFPSSPESLPAGL